MRKRTKELVIAGMMAAVLLCVGCAVMESGGAADTVSDTGFIKSEPGYYDSRDTAIVIEKKEEEKTITFFNREVSRNYTLKYDGATQLYDKYDEAMSASQINPGDIVDVTFVKQSRRLNSLSVSKESWSYTNVEKFSFGRNNQTMTVGNEEFKLFKEAIVISNGKQVEIMDLTDSDCICVKGIDNTVYSITVEKGHGYLRLQNDEYFVGGWIEVGQKVIKPITQDMLLVVPEGSYDVLLTNTRISGNREITIERDQELSLDVGDIQPEEMKYGTILFQIVPDTAMLYIDGKETDYSVPVTLEYGIHQMITQAPGYKSATSYIRVGQEKATIHVELDAKAENSAPEDTGANNSNSLIDSNTVSSDNTVNPVVQSATSSVTGSRVYIDSPEGAELYVDSNYIGVVPVAFSKSAGTHVISLRKTGYQTKTYTLQLDSEAKDVTYSFAELVKQIGAEQLGTFIN